MKKDDKKPIYIQCPRCELNYINKKDKLCNICKAEVGLLDPSILIPDEEEVGIEKLCPVCNVNFIGEDEEICFLCQKEQEEKEKAAVEHEDDTWLNFVEDTPEEIPPEELEISLSELAEEEEEFEDDEFADKYKEPDDFNFDVDPDDYDDDEEEEEEEDDSF